MAKKKKRRQPLPQPKSVDQGKRSFFKWAMRTSGAILTGAAGSALFSSLQSLRTEGLVDKQWSRSVGSSVAHRRADLIERLLLNVRENTDFIPPTNWAVMPPDVDTGGDVFTYEHEARVLEAMKGFFSEVQWRIASDMDRSVEFSHSLVLLGSGVSNYATREYLGDANAPRFEVAVRGYGNVPLPYGIAYVPDRAIERLQYREVRVGPESAFVDSAGNVVAIPQTGRSNQLLEDFLMVTRIPGRVFFTGLHGPGTRATELFFQSDPTMLEHLEIELNAGQNVPYFQAIFRATDMVEKGGSLVATHLECMRNPCPPVRLA
jgi:hypothetical protein